MAPSLEERVSPISKLPINSNVGHVSHCTVWSIKEKVKGAGCSQTSLCSVASGTSICDGAFVLALWEILKER